MPVSPSSSSSANSSYSGRALRTSSPSGGEGFSALIEVVAQLGAPNAQALPAPQTKSGSGNGSAGGGGHSQEGSSTLSQLPLGAKSQGSSVSVKTADHHKIPLSRSELASQAGASEFVSKGSASASALSGAEARTASLGKSEQHQGGSAGTVSPSGVSVGTQYQGLTKVGLGLVQGGTRRLTTNGGGSQESATASVVVEGGTGTIQVSPGKKVGATTDASVSGTSLSPLNILGSTSKTKPDSSGLPTGPHVVEPTSISVSSAQISIDSNPYVGIQASPLASQATHDTKVTGGTARIDLVGAKSSQSDSVQTFALAAGVLVPQQIPISSQKFPLSVAMEAPALHPGALEEMVSVISSHMSANPSLPSTLHVRLFPQAMGVLDVHLSELNGSLSVRLNGSSAELGSQLNNSMGDLAKALQESLSASVTLTLGSFGSGTSGQGSRGSGSPGDSLTDMQGGTVVLAEARRPVHVGSPKVISTHVLDIKA